ncbi:hypothetical protein M9458_058221 [Cirrhinus mrigala]|uniref:Protein kinase domain-containing protein n=1 Tax=Cirrhinus mrigala TaxID=683832 RepID=A0ABD0MBA9_CIRMR
MHKQIDQFSKKAVLTDWGLANIRDTIILRQGSRLPGAGIGSMGGTFLYMAPECLIEYEQASRSSDIWSLGATYLEIFSISVPWTVKKKQRELSSLMGKKVPPHALQSSLAHPSSPEVLSHPQPRTCGPLPDSGRSQLSDSYRGPLTDSGSGQLMAPRSSKPATAPRSGLPASNMASHIYHKDIMDQFGLLSPSSLLVPSSPPSSLLVLSRPPKSPLVPSSAGAARAPSRAGNLQGLSVLQSRCPPVTYRYPPDPPWPSGLCTRPWLPELPDPPWHPGLYAPPWLPEFPDPPWRRTSSPSCVCPAQASRAPTLPPRCICYCAFVVVDCF